ncbi:hypothetical protein [Tumidithrix elongata]
MFARDRSYVSPDVFLMCKVGQEAKGRVRPALALKLKRETET